MTTPSLAMLDQTELLQLAITSGERNDASSAIVYLKEAVSRPDASANAHFLLGAEYAEIGLYDRAKACMKTALQLDPNSSITRFQLGLLLVSCGNSVEAEDVLRPIQDANDILTPFAKGLIYLIHNEFDSALNAFHQGMALNSHNPALVKNMQALVNGIEQLPPEVRAQSQADESHGQHILLSAYTGSGTLH